jgi:hypothetical protein
MSWTRALVVWIMLAMSPLSGLRIVCVIDPHETDASLQSDDPLACQSVCSLHPRASYRTRCALVEDPSCAYALGTTTAVLPAAPALPFTMTSEPFDRGPRVSYPRPALDRASPPPKA